MADLADFQKLASKNQRYKWMLVIQDMFSRKIEKIAAQKRKTAVETAGTLDVVFSDARVVPDKLLTDKGGEFFGSCKEVYKEYDVHHYTTNDVTQKVAPLERSLRTLKQRLFRMMAAEGSWVWIDKLDSLKEVFNASPNRDIGMTPNEAEKPENAARVYYNSVTRPEQQKLKKQLQFEYDVGQIVRVLDDRTFGKAYLGRFSSKLYEIHARNFMTGVPVYHLNDLLTREPIIGSWYQEELQPVNIDRQDLPKIEHIYQTRWDAYGQEEVQVKFEGPGRKVWVKYDDLIPYK